MPGELGLYNDLDRRIFDSMREVDTIVHKFDLAKEREEKILYEAFTGLPEVEKPSNEFLAMKAHTLSVFCRRVEKTLGVLLDGRAISKEALPPPPETSGDRLELKEKNRARMERQSVSAGRAGAILMKTDDQQRTALHRAAMKGNDQAVNVVLMQPAGMTTLWAKDNGGMTALHWAAFMGHTEVVDLILQVDVREKLGALDFNDDKHEMNALHWACLGGSTQVVEAMLCHDVVVEDPDELDNLCEGDALGRSPLHVAAHKGHAGVAKALIKEGPPDLHTYVDKQNRTALHTAAFKGYVDVVKEILEHEEAHVLLRMLDEDMKTAEDLAVAVGTERHDAVVKYLRKWERKAVKEGLISGDNVKASNLLEDSDSEEEDAA
jgi:ankyrin repeat protein